MPSKELSIYLRMKDFASKEFSKVRRGLRGIRSAVQRVGGAFRGLLKISTGSLGIVGATFGVRAVGDLIEYAGGIENIERAFGNLTQEADGARATLEALRKGTRGTVDDFNLMKLANQAMLLGVAKTSDEFEELTSLARRLGQAVGRSTVDSFNDLVTGIGRQSKLILDNLGIIVKLEDAYKQYAGTLGKTASELTEAEKKQAFLTATLTAAREKVAALGEDSKSVLSTWGALKALFSNVGQILIKSFTPSIQKILDSSKEFLQEHIPAIGRFFIGTIQFLSRAAIGILQIVDGIDRLVARVEGIRQVFASIGPAVRQGLKVATGGLSEVIIGMGSLVDVVSLSSQESVSETGTAIQAMIEDIRRGTNQVTDEIDAAFRRMADSQRAFSAGISDQDLQGMLDFGTKSAQEAARNQEQLSAALANAAAAWSATKAKVVDAAGAISKALDEFSATSRERAMAYMRETSEQLFRIRDAMSDASWTQNERGPLGLSDAQFEEWHRHMRAVHDVQGMVRDEFRAMGYEAQEFGRLAVDAVRAVGQSLVYNITDGLMAAIDGTKSAKEAFADMAKSILRDLAAIMIQQTLSAAVGSIFGGIGGLFPSRQTGGYVPYTGLYQLHQGERVQTAREVRESHTHNSPTVVFNYSPSYVDARHEASLLERNRDRILGMVAEGVNSSLATRNAIRGGARA